MTSIPASRSAEAITLAPRSCPSRPGFPTRTRIFLTVIFAPRLASATGLRVARLRLASGSPPSVAFARRSSKLRRHVGAEHAPQRAGDLSDGGVGAHRLHHLR